LIERDADDQFIQRGRHRPAGAVDEALVQLAHRTGPAHLCQLLGGEEVVVLLERTMKIGGAQTHENEIRRIEEAQRLSHVDVRQRGSPQGSTGHHAGRS